MSDNNTYDDAKKIHDLAMEAFLDAYPYGSPQSKLYHEIHSNMLDAKARELGLGRRQSSGMSADDYKGYDG